MPCLRGGVRAMTLLSAEGVGLSLGGREVLHGVDLEVERGEIVTVIGPNGAGKTTLLRVLLGALTPARGRVHRAPGLAIGYVPQRLQIDPTLPLSAAGFLRLGRRADTGEIARALEETGVGALARRALADLSGGQLQRVLLARALLGRPDLLILDEPDQSLDQPATAALYRRIEAARARLGCGVLLVSHDLHVVMAASDRVICLNGHVCCAGTPHAVAAAPEYRALFGTGTGGALALYRHEHTHRHEPAEEPGH